MYSQNVILVNKRLGYYKLELITSGEKEPGNQNYQ